MAVLVVDTTGGEPIEDHALRVAEAWKGGLQGKDNGLLFVLAVKDRRSRLEVGYGLEAHLPDDVVRRLLEDQGPLWRQGNWRGGVLGIIQGVQARLPADEAPPPAPTAPKAGALKFLFAMLFITSLVAGVGFGLRVTAWRAEAARTWTLGVVAAFTLGPLAVIAVAALLLGIPLQHALGLYVGFFTLFFLGALALNRRLSFGVTLIGSPVTSFGLTAMLGTSPPPQTLLDFLSEAGPFTLAAALVLQFFVGTVLDWTNRQEDSHTLQASPRPRPPVDYLRSVRNNSRAASDAQSRSSLFGSNRSGSSSSSSSSWWSSSSSDSSSSEASSSSSSSSSDSSSDDWKGGGGSFGGGGASSSW